MRGKHSGAGGEALHEHEAHGGGWIYIYLSVPRTEPRNRERHALPTRGSTPAGTGKLWGGGQGITGDRHGRKPTTSGARREERAGGQVGRINPPAHEARRGTATGAGRRGEEAEQWRPALSPSGCAQGLIVGASSVRRKRPGGRGEGGGERSQAPPSPTPSLVHAAPLPSPQLRLYQRTRLGFRRRRRRMGMETGVGAGAGAGEATGRGGRGEGGDRDPQEPKVSLEGEGARRRRGEEGERTSRRGHKGQGNHRARGRKGKQAITTRSQIPILPSQVVCGRQWGGSMVVMALSDSKERTRKRERRQWVGLYSLWKCGRHLFRDTILAGPGPGRIGGEIEGRWGLSRF
ncbi:uncharacterized protein LAJ45_06106 [Morchella importuna]|uniref:uncharacterized protein n=1 Tax=Morchella importuna TaxID=1174673 RepID=UPI001E8E2340|nr:uncharacterized protein LAJ45_06106 [Morchella importuna]KAH8149953.1 hypothetical protein LAJ45_06106 [Morchella importuna]